MLGLSGASNGLGLPLVPFTFPTLLFRRAALQYPYPSLTVSWIDKIWSIYKEGRRSGKNPGGNTAATKRYLVGQGVPEYLAGAWLATADVAAGEWWGQGTYFADFGASDGVTGAFSGLVQGSVEALRNVGDAVVTGAARAVGVPRWIMWAVVVVVVVLVGYFAWKSSAVSRALKRF